MHLRPHAPGIGLAAVLVLFVLVRLPLLVGSGVLHGWNSDAAILGLMAKKILDGRGFDFFFWGQNYLGPLTSLVAAAIGAVRQLLGISPAAGPMALRLATMLMVAGGIVIFWLTLRRFSLAVATLTATFLAIGPYVLYRASVVAWGVDMAFLLGAAILAIGSRATPWTPAAQRFGFGVLCGFSWWMNQQVIFAIAAVPWVVVRQTDWFRIAGEHLRIKDRLLFRTSTFRRSERALLLLTQTLLVAELLYVALRDIYQWPTPVPGFRWHFGEPFVALVLLHVIVAAATRDPIVTSIRWRAVATYLAPIAAGFVLGYAPVILGGLLGWYPRAYTFGARFSDPAILIAATRDFFGGLLPSAFGSVSAMLVAAAVVALWLYRFRRPLPLFVEALLVAATLNLLYCLLIIKPPIARRYLVAAIPGLFAIVAIAIVDIGRRWRPAAVAAAIALLLSLGISSYEMMIDLRSDLDPRRVIGHLRRNGCRVVYAEFWTAYKHRFLSNEEFLFIVHQSLDRSPSDSAAFAREPGRRCLLEHSGRIKLMHELPAVADVVRQDVLTQTIR